MYDYCRRIAYMQGWRAAKAGKPITACFLKADLVLKALWEQGWREAWICE